MSTSESMLTMSVKRATQETLHSPDTIIWMLIGLVLGVGLAIFNIWFAFARPSLERQVLDFKLEVRGRLAQIYINEGASTSNDTFPILAKIEYDLCTMCLGRRKYKECDTMPLMGACGRFEAMMSSPRIGVPLLWPNHMMKKENGTGGLE